MKKHRVGLAFGALWFHVWVGTSQARRGRPWLGHFTAPPSSFFPSQPVLSPRHNQLLLLLREIRGGNNHDDSKDKDSCTNPLSSCDETYHVLSVLPVQDATTVSTHDWLQPGCTILGDSSAMATLQHYRGRATIWHGHNLALVESLAVASHVIVLALAKPNQVLTTDVAQALRRGWQRRQDQGLSPGRLWVVWTADNNTDSANDESKTKKWMEQIVLDEGMTELVTPSKSPDFIADWQLIRGPTAYEAAIREFVVQQRQQQQQQQERSDPVMMVPAKAVPLLVSQIYDKIIGKETTKKGEALFVSDPSMEVASEISSLVEDGSRQIPESLTDESTFFATQAVDEPVEEKTMEANVWFVLEQAQSQLDEYWLGEASSPKSGISMPPDLVQVVAPILTRNKKKYPWTSSQTSSSLAAEAEIRLVSLTEQHAGILRDYYGRLFESLLENGRAHDKSASSLLKQYQSVAQRVTKTLQRHVEENIQELYHSSFQGLQEDVLEIMDRWKSTADVLLEDEDEDGEGGDGATRRRRVPPWLQRLGARVLVLSVNYLQGWLAWQGIQRAAMARERQLPKFPLF